MKPNLVYLTGGSVISLIVGVIVTIVLPAQDAGGPSPRARPYSELEARGRDIYLREGCHYCHSQQVRAPEADKGMVREEGDIGPESIPGDYHYESPVFWGTQRQGPDLSHVASRGVGGNPAWNKLHFKEPRGVSPGTVMPSYDYLSDAELDALTAYMLALE
jgi:cbb3-type cytochrome c oxidase subunit II